MKKLKPNKININVNRAALMHEFLRIIGIECLDIVNMLSWARICLPQNGGICHHDGMSPKGKKNISKCYCCWVDYLEEKIPGFKRNLPPE